jgi:hypothetical protein
MQTLKSRPNRSFPSWTKEPRSRQKPLVHNFKAFHSNRSTFILIFKAFRSNRSAWDKTFVSKPFSVRSTFQWWSSAFQDQFLSLLRYSHRIRCFSVCTCIKPTKFGNKFRLRTKSNKISFRLAVLNVNISLNFVRSDTWSLYCFLPPYVHKIYARRHLNFKSTKLLSNKKHQNITFRPFTLLFLMINYNLDSLITVSLTKMGKGNIHI